MESFETEFNKLNAEQKKAVQAIEGPILVVAGPGTGKTQLLGMRVANILRETDTDAASILCLTFTNKAATNMRDRLLRLAGPTARNVMVRTFHSFAAEIMNMYPDYFWNGARLSVAPDAVQLEIVESILSELPLDNPLALKFAGQFTAVKAVQQALKLVKESGLTPEKLRAIIDLNLAYINDIESSMCELLAPVLSAKKLPELAAAVSALPGQGLNEQTAPLIALDSVIQESLRFAISQDEPTGKTTQAGKWKKRWVQTVNGQKGMFDERKRNAWWLAIADAYELYRRQLHSRGYYDYSDMLVEVITQVEQHDDLRASIQERFLYVLIDEFQDTNAAQLRLAQLVSDHYASDGKPNIMAVGDDDQSIYKFNGAELKNMLTFTRMYPAAKLFVLSENYRSSQAVLDTAKLAIEQAADRLVNREPQLSKDLRAANEPKVKGTIEHLTYPSREHQLSNVARLLQGEQAKRLSTVAVLARGHDSLRQLAGLLIHLGVPLRYEQSNDIFTHEAVVQILRLAELVVAIQAGDETTVNARLAQTLRHPMWHIEPKLLWQLAIENARNEHWLDSLAGSKDSQLQAISHWLFWLAGESDRQPLSIMLEYLIGLRPGENLTSPLREYYLGKSVDSEYLAALSAIKLLIGFASDFARGTQANLEDFIRFTTVIRNNGQVIADESPFVSQEGAIELYTVHKAKGLEFDTVYIIDAVEKNWQPPSGGRKPPANLPLQPNGDDYDDYIRLMYVALTRAKHTLVITSYRADAGGSEVLATPIIRAAIPDVRALSAQESGELLTVLEESMRWPRLTATDELHLLHDILENYRLSPTHLLAFLDITSGGPASFLEDCLLGLPHAQTAAMAFGTAMHAALEFAQKQVNSGPLDLAVVRSEYETVLREQRLPIQELDRYLQHGQDTLDKLFNELHYQLPEGSLPEQKFSEIAADGCHLTGKIDRIDRQAGNEIIIVDYKTGKPLSSFDTKDQTKEIKAWRHKSQLAFYALLVGQSPRFAHTTSIIGRMVYVEAAAVRELERSYIPSEEDIERLQRLVAAVWRHIKQLDLPDTSTYAQNLSGIQQFEQDLLDGKI